MNLSPAWVPFLTEAGLECVHWIALADPKDFRLGLAGFCEPVRCPRHEKPWARG